MYQGTSSQLLVKSCTGVGKRIRYSTIGKSQSTRNNDPLLSLIVYTPNNAHRGKKAGRHGVQKHTCEVQFVFISDILGDTVGVLVCRSSCREYRPLETMLVVVLHIDTGLRKTERRTSTRAMIFSLDNLSNYLFALQGSRKFNKGRSSQGTILCDVDE